MPVTMTTRVALALAAAGLSVVAAPSATAHEGAGDVATNTRGEQVAERGAGVRMSHVANLQYDRSGEAQNGSDIEFVRIDGRDYALAGTLDLGMQIIDITRPTAPRRVAVYDCKVSQGDIQVWKKKNRVLASYTADSTLGEEGAASRCGRDLKLGLDDAGTIIVDLTTPSRPQSVSFLSVPRGSHNMTVHPSGNFLYNSNSDLATSTAPAVTIYDISRPSLPKKVQDYRIPYVPTSLGSESHDITFNASGTRAFVAALSQTLILDTRNPRAPKQIGQIIDPSINVVHQSDPVTLRRKDGSTRSLLVITDERAGAAASVECPGGGLHVYDITGSRVSEPVKIGAWFIDAVRPQEGTTCTSHVLRMYPRQKLMTIAWYSQGVRVIDIRGLATATGSPETVAMGSGIGMREVGHYVFPDSDTWSFKTNRISRNGSFYGYGNDLVRGFDVYRFRGLTNRTVPPLVPQDLGSDHRSTPSGLLAPAAAVVPAVWVALLLHRRGRRRPS
ncbi:hypothetical protein NSZ01_20150 [Nocardioides szechwanensis]|uniref:LVIVD repeat-containing protein n=2 Tax=Nocardioides szechwanensis TaxID=1005944 RepID=A0A1H0HBS7_9ACTN|nr:hypothetical protein NSZ01_20150 [Nocardioides szechwanensis]SDO16514.1 hypothetical protein SAMN05192576_3530 [Nocardioides szechwanensis]